MEFPPRPENDFAEYIRTYYRECRQRCPKIEGIAGKWMFRDLAPGLSDFDTRFLVPDDMSVADWCAMSMAVGEAHLALCRKYPSWARNLEHLPGVNLTWRELSDERTYYPEFHQWTYYATEQPERLGQALRWLEQRPWDGKDEYFHLKKFCLYFGPYDRQIDPPINLHAQAAKYPLHSRLMHYFNPPVMSAMCLLLRENVPGKLDAFDLAAREFPGLPCWAMVQEILHAGYEAPAYYSEPQLSGLENALAEGLHALAKRLREVITLVPASAGVDISAWKAALREAPVDPALVIFDSVRFARLMKGRLWFYLRAPRRFESDWLIHNELLRIGANFFRTPFSKYWQLKTGQALADPATILPQLEFLSPAEVQAAQRFDRLTADVAAAGGERAAAEGLVEIYDDFLGALTKLVNAI